MPIALVTMDFVSKKSGQLNVSISDDLADTLETIRKKHGVPPPELVRQLLDGVKAFYDKNGFFSLPVHIEPEASFLQRARQYKSDADLPQVAGKDADLKQTPKPRKTA